MVRAGWLAIAAVVLSTGSLSAQFARIDPASDSNDSQKLFLTGRVSLEDGSSVPVPVTVKSDCSGEVHTFGYTDSAGNFGFAIADGPSAGPGMSPSDSAAVDMRQLASCDLRLEAPGLAIQKVSLARIAGESGMVNLGRIVMHPATPQGSYTVSAADAAVPDKARKEFEKGKKEASKGKIAAARDMFQKLATRYPKFALAWIELGRMQLQESDADAAKQSFREALSADQKLATPYIELAQLALRDGNWQELADTSNRLLEIAPSYPQFWFFNAIGNYNLQHFPQAEKSLLRGLALDPQHRIPKMEYLLGLVLETKHDYSSAAERFANYLKFAPHDDDAALAQRQLRDCQSAASLGVGGSK